MTVIFWLWTFLLVVLVVAFIVIGVLMFAHGGALRDPTRQDRGD